MFQFSCDVCMRLPFDQQQHQQTPCTESCFSNPVDITVAVVKISQGDPGNHPCPSSTEPSGGHQVYRRSLTCDALRHITSLTTNIPLITNVPKGPTVDITSQSQRHLLVTLGPSGHI